MDTINIKPENINILHEVLVKHFFGNAMIESINIYKNSLVYLTIKINNIHFSLDVYLDSTIDIVFRNDETRKFYSEYFKCNLNVKNNILGKEEVLNKVFQVSANNILDIVEETLDFLVSIENDSNMRLKKINESVFILSQQIIEDNRNKTFLDMDLFLRDKQLSILDTLKVIKEKELSIARFGDGEIRCMITKNGCGFQKHDWKLMSELMEINREKSDLLVCYPGFLVYENFWLNFWREYWARVKCYIKQDVLGDAMITRPEAFYLHGHDISKLWIDIWDNKNICFVTGKSSRLNSNHHLFSNLKNASYVYTKNNNGYECIDEIYSNCLKEKNIDIFLIALGPTGTALAARLHNSGRRALDIGHLNNSFDTVFEGCVRPEKVKYEKNIY